ncbi:ORF6N domain-containing protein [Galbibacter sp. EGI 63066]|uniref:ORF6N domain-containing protein n=1 Tax=Galbibacter sp. EGI 63066 TaxID=2993559 RepID=UPI00224941EE|nr:ORF6N domain-containing protein [Galbibacter sp. EGI 63066]MCX2681904.1 ORF6N domain-containing protein [Galbibacter sp. EGI 63066]
MVKKTEILSAMPIENKIHIFRGQRVMIDSDLAELYDVETKVLNQAVKRNSSRFPEDFMFQLSDEEFKILRSQIVTSNWGGRRTPPYAFTEHGTVMLASILRSQTAVEVSIQIVKAFVKFREILTSQAGLAKKIDELENKYDDQFKQVFEAIRQLMTNSTQVSSIKKGRKD